MPITNPSRRDFLAATAIATTLLPLAGRARAQDYPQFVPEQPFEFEIQRTDAEWREFLSDDEYNILREGGTEWPTTHPLWNDYTPGNFHCKGCGLHLYSSDWRQELLIGWVFFHHAVPDAVLMGIDDTNPYGGDENAKPVIEAHCRRCGSHLGHIVYVSNLLLHCINGTALVREEFAA